MEMHMDSEYNKHHFRKGFDTTSRLVLLRNLSKCELQEQTTSLVIKGSQSTGSSGKPPSGTREQKRALRTLSIERKRSPSPCLRNQERRAETTIEESRPAGQTEGQE